MAIGELSIAQVGMPMEEFIQAFDADGPFELINGERKPVMPNVAGHGSVIKLLYDLLIRFEKPAQMVVHREQTYIITYSSKWVTGSRIPDIMIYSEARLQAYLRATPNWQSLPFVLVPDLVIEVISPTDNSGEVDEKIARYLGDGVAIVWVLYPRTQTVLVYEQGSELIKRLMMDDLLDGGVVIAGFSIKVADIFAV
jgi:Uma2 family endonuclease